LGEILSFGLWMNKQGYRRSTVHYCVRALKSIARQISLLDPESVKTYLATMEVSEARKAKLVEDLARWSSRSRRSSERKRGHTITLLLSTLVIYDPLFPCSLNLCVTRILSARLSCIGVQIPYQTLFLVLSFGGDALPMRQAG
jgi:hypothetical protein